MTSFLNEVSDGKRSVVDVVVPLPVYQIQFSSRKLGGCCFQDCPTAITTVTELLLLSLYY